MNKQWWIRVTLHQYSSHCDVFFLFCLLLFDVELKCDDCRCGHRIIASWHAMRVNNQAHNLRQTIKRKKMNSKQYVWIFDLIRFGVIAIFGFIHSYIHIHVLGECGGNRKKIKFNCWLKL